MLLDDVLVVLVLLIGMEVFFVLSTSNTYINDVTNIIFKVLLHDDIHFLLKHGSCLTALQVVSGCNNEGLIVLQVTTFSDYVHQGVASDNLGEVKNRGLTLINNNLKSYGMW